MEDGGVKWVIVVGLMGDWIVPGEGPKRRQRLRARWVPTNQKILDFLYEIYINTFPRLAK